MAKRPALNQPRATTGPVTDTSVPKGMLRVATTMAVPALLREHGVDPVPVLAEFGLELPDYEDPENRIRYSTVTRLLNRCTEVTRCPHFGLLVGQRAGTSALGAVGFLMQSSPNVRTALEILVHHLWVHSPSAAAGLVEDGAYTTLSFTIDWTGLEGSEAYLDMAIAVAFNIMRGLCGHHWQSSEVRFAHGRPRSLTPFRRFFQAPLAFDTGETALVFQRDWLDAPLVSADPLLHAMMQQRVSELESLAHNDVASQLRRMLPSLITTYSDSLTVAARRIGLATRTLNRRLAAEGTSYLQLREQARYAIARQLLTGTSMPANQIADRLGYANASAFTRAFRQWSGAAPAQWRARTRRPRKRVPATTMAAR
jgi:AraC-like DNA-binding protein